MNCHILVVEDDKDIRETLQQVLELDGYFVCTASNGKDGLDVLQKMEKRPCVILLDLMMPIMNGWEFLKAQKEDNSYSNIPVVVVSAFNEKTGDTARASAFLKKPVDLDVLSRLVEGYCTDGKPS